MLKTIKSPRKDSDEKGKERGMKRFRADDEKFELELPKESRPFNADFFGAMVGSWIKHFD